MDDDLKTAMKRNLHLKKYIYKLKKQTGEFPEFHHHLTRDNLKHDSLNLVYPIGDPIFIHVFKNNRGIFYKTIEPVLFGITKKIFNELLDIIFIAVGEEPVYESKREFEKTIERIINRYTEIIPEPNENYSRRNFFSEGFPKIKKIKLTKGQLAIIKYHLKRKLTENGILEPLLRDPYIEDITCMGKTNFHIVHKIFGVLPTNIKFNDDIEQKIFFEILTEKIGRSVNIARPILDATMPDGSRLSLIYSDDISLKGPTMSIRKFLSEPFGITQLVKWGTISSEIAAYLWLCLEYGMSVFICGESASGKTSTFNSILPFIRYDSKIYSCEDTSEISPPHRIWQQLLTREIGENDAKVDMYTLLKAALRSRPNYILVGEIRGAEGAVAFQAMQTGHPVISTFHASSVTSMIQRFTGHPINVPIRFMDNLNVVLIQNAIYRGGSLIRRITSIDEIMVYSEELNGILTRNVFSWNSTTDEHRFRGKNNSYILEEKVGKNKGFGDKKNIYFELEKRKKIIDVLVERNILNYNEVLDIIKDFQMNGMFNFSFELT